MLDISFACYQRFLHFPVCRGLVRCVLLAALWLVPCSAAAQVGTVQYAHTYPLLHSHYSVYRAVTSSLQDMEYVAPPSHATEARSLVFDSVASLMYPLDKEHLEPEHRPSSGGVEHIDTTFVRFEDASFVETRVLPFVVSYLGRVRGNLPDFGWHLDGEERTYLGFRVMKATAKVDTAHIEAWFTPDIPVPAGPGLYGGLPGLILMVTNSTIGEVYAAESVTMDVLARAVMQPTRGSEVSEREYARTKVESIEGDRRFWESQLREIEEGKQVWIKRGSQ